MFSRAAYNVDEDAGLAKLVLVLSNPSSTTFTVKVLDVNESAIGKYVCNIWIKRS